MEEKIWGSQKITKKEKMTEKILIPKIEVRTSLNKGIKKYIIKGYAATAGNIYPYAKIKEDGRAKRTLKEYFTTKALENIRKKAKHEKIWIDYGHHKTFGLHSERTLKAIEKKTGLDLSEEKDYFKDAFKVGDIPMFKLHDIQIDDKGLFVEIHGNPYYQNSDDDRAKYFDAVWSSLEGGFINGMSLDMKPTKVVPINNELNQIDDVDIYGISLLAGASNDEANITEVVARCCMNRGEKTCQKKMMRKKLML